MSAGKFLPSVWTDWLLVVFYKLIFFICLVEFKIFKKSKTVFLVPSSSDTRKDCRTENQGQSYVYYNKTKKIYKKHYVILLIASINRLGLLLVKKAGQHEYVPYLQKGN